MTPAERRALAKKIPWVTFLGSRGKDRCTAIRSGAPLKAYHGTPAQIAEAAVKYRCKNRGIWRFKALKRSYAGDGTYCWSHLVYRGLHGGMEEDARLERWMRKHGHW